MASAFARSALAAAGWWALLPLLAGRGEGGAPQDEYERLCTEIEDQSTLAGRLYNAGRQAEAFAALDRSRQSFKAAKKLSPDEPQAYISMATAMLSSNHLDEALPLWKAARKRVSDPATAAWLEGRARWTKYGKVSMKRDRVYANGQGNLTAALSLMAKQLNIYPRSPQLHHDRATAQVMVSELRGASAVALAADGFREAQEAALEAWRAGLQERGEGGCAAGSGGLVHDWPAWFAAGPASRGALAALDVVPGAEAAAYGAEGAFKDQPGYLATFDHVGLAGDDGLILDEARCTVFLASAGSFVNLVANLQMLEVWGDPPMPAPSGGGRPFRWHDQSRGQLPEHGAVAKPHDVERAASIVQFADTSHFHMLTEVFGRLWLLQRRGVLDEPGVQLVAPSDPRKGKGFLSVALGALVPGLLREGRVVWWQRGGPNDVRLRVGKLHYADWRPPAAFTEDGGHCATPRAVLAPAREGLRAALGPPGEDGQAAEAPRRLVFVLRKGQDMRSELENEAGLRQRLQRAAEAAEPRLAFEEFGGGAAPAATARLFSRARAVVGVHGGALTNILFCPQDAVLFELGFSSPFAGHYRHLAAALGLRAVLLPLAADERGMGSARVRLRDLEAAAQAVRAELAPPGGGGAGAAAGRPEL